MEQLEYRKFEVRSVDTEKREITGIVAPYGQTIDLGEYKERYEKGVFNGSKNVKLFDEHREAIGLVTKHVDTDEGHQVTARISETRAGNDVWILVKDGVKESLSSGFIPGVDRVDEDGTVVRVKADLKEVSTVVFPAYSKAVITEARNEELSEVRTSENTNNEKEDKNMSEEITFASASEVADLRDAVAELERRATLNGGGGTEVTTTQFRSAGDYLKALAMPDDARHQAAQLEARAYSGATTADTYSPTAWYDALLRIVNRGRPLVNLFSQGPLEGLTVDYPKITATTGAVASQGVEGADLTLLKLTTSHATKAALTFGVNSQVTFQIIEFAKVAYLQKVLEAQAASYAKVTNDYVRSVLTAATPLTGDGFTLASVVTKDVLDAVTDGVSQLYNSTGVEAEFILVSTDVWKTLAGMTDGASGAGRPVFDINADSVNSIGDINVRGLKGQIAGLPLIVDNGLSAKTMYIGAREALTTWEKAGTPFRVDDMNPLNLTRSYSIYGFMACDATNASALVKPAIA